jgi:hypothetical protein
MISPERHAAPVVPPVGVLGRLPGKWDLHALETLVPAAGSGTLRIITPSGKDVWEWDGHSMSWNNQWMQSAPAKGSHHGTRRGGGGNGTSSQGSTSHGGCGSWDLTSAKFWV